MSEIKPTGLTQNENFLYELGLVFFGLEYEDRMYQRDLVVSKSLIPKLFTIARAVIDLESCNESHPRRYSPWHTTRVIPFDSKLEEFFASFPYKEAYDDLCKILKTNYKKTREVSRIPVGERYIVKETRGVRDVIEQTWRRNVEVDIIKRKVKVINESYNPIAEGAVKSLMQIANSNPDITERIKEAIAYYQSAPRETSERVWEETLDEICSNPPEPEQDERWQDWTD